MDLAGGRSWKNRKQKQETEMNILTFDIEEWALDKVGGYGTTERYAVYDAYLNRILDLLDEHSVKATFFCTGLMAVHFPQVVKLIQSRGHEIGCHSNIHTWLNKMSEEECRQDTYRAVDSLRQCVGEKVVSYRAPAFSIGESNKWAFEVLAENGIQNDASVFPASRDFGGFPNFGYNEPVTLQLKEANIREFPIPVCSLFGHKVAFSGGGYLRLFPLMFIKRELKLAHYGMIYLHIADMMEEKEPLMSRNEYEDYFMEKGSLFARMKRYLKANVGRTKTIQKMDNILEIGGFVTIEQASLIIDWENQSVRVL